MPTGAPNGSVWLDTDATSTTVFEQCWRKAVVSAGTSITGADDYALTLAYTVGFEQVYLNGVLLVRAVDYTATDGSTITLTTATTVGDYVEISTTSTFVAANTYTQSAANAAFYQVATTPMAGKNFVINGGMDFWQRGTSFTNPGSTYTVDRWVGYWSASGTVTQETTNVPSGCRYALKMTSTATSAGNNFYQLIETNNTIPLAGKTVTFSAYVAGTNGKTPIIGIDTSTVVDDSLFGSWTGLATSSSVTTSSTYQRLTVTATIPSNTKSLRVHLDSYPVNNTDYLLWSGVQLEVGSVASAFSRAGSTIGGELALCQRYYYRLTSVGSSSNYQHFGMGQAYSTSAAKVPIFLPVAMRTSPSVSSSGSIGLLNSINSSVANASIQNDGINTTIAGTVWSGSSGLVAGNATTLIANGNSTCFIEFSSEL
jgi:hypothetical protein